MTINRSGGYDEARRIMLERKISVLPVVDSSGRLVDYMSWPDVFGEKALKERTIDVPVVIMAGGKGTRLDPFTKILPKPLIPIGDKPIVENIMDRFHEYGVRDFYLTINYKGEMIKSYFDNTETPYSVNYVSEEKFMGTAGSLRLLPESFPDTFILSNCDVVIEADYSSIVEFHGRKGNTLTIVGSMQHYKIPYGVIKLEKDGTLGTITEKPEYDLMVNTGLYVLDRSVLDLIPEGREFHMTDLISSVMEEGGRVSVYPVSEGSYMDVGQWDEYKRSMERML
jgi:NDP-sugar pyrophosphorylase family protein